MHHPQNITNQYKTHSNFQQDNLPVPVSTYSFHKYHLSTIMHYNPWETHKIMTSLNMHTM